MINELSENGYLVLERFLTDSECDELFQVGISFTEDLPPKEQRAIFSTTDAVNQHHIDEYFLNSNDKIRCFFEKDALDSDGNLKIESRVALNKVGHALHLLNPKFRKYTYSDKSKSICRQLKLESPAVVQSMYIYKNPGVGGEVKPHQDATYLYTEPQPAIGFWIALEDATIENGCLWIAKGSHKSGVNHRLVRNPDRYTSPILIYDKPAPNYEEIKFTPVPVKKGTCIVLHGLVVHKSAHNNSSKSRHAYTFHVIEKLNNKYSEQNWLVEGPGAPFVPLYTTSPDI